MLLHDPVNDLLGALAIANIGLGGLDGESLGGQFGDQRFSRLAIAAVDQRDGGAAPGQLDHARTPDPAAPARDQGNPPIQLHHVLTFITRSTEKEARSRRGVRAFYAVPIGCLVPDPVRSNANWDRSSSISASSIQACRGFSSARLYRRRTICPRTVT